MSEVNGKVLTWTAKCEECGGTGEYLHLMSKPGVHFACKGTGRLIVKAMSDKQVNFIRGLFNELVKMEFIVSGDQLWNTIVPLMLAHKEAVAIENIDNMLTTKHANEIIRVLKLHKSRSLDAVRNPQNLDESLSVKHADEIIQNLYLNNK